MGRKDIILIHVAGILREFPAEIKVGTGLGLFPRSCGRSLGNRLSLGVILVVVLVSVLLAYIPVQHIVHALFNLVADVLLSGVLGPLSQLLQ